MKIKTSTICATTILAATLSPICSAHVVVTNERLHSAAYSQIDLAIPHGCEGFDTVQVEVSLPEGLSGVRPINSVFGAATVTKTTVTIDGEDKEVVSKITWTRTADELYDTDSHAYNISFRTKTPDAPFKMLYFPTVQTCEDPSGNVYTNNWVGTGGHHDHNAQSDEKPAPSAMLYPSRTPGWNKYTINEHVHDLSVFNDAEIIWMGNEAYSANPAIYKMIQDDTDTQVLELIHPDSEVWVKY